MTAKQVADKAISAFLDAFEYLGVDLMVEHDECDAARARALCQFGDADTADAAAADQITLRTYLSAMAMMGILSQHTSIEYKDGGRDTEPAYQFDEIPALALRQADMLIAELNKQQ